MSPLGRLRLGCLTALQVLLEEMYEHHRSGQSTAIHIKYQRTESNTAEPLVVQIHVLSLCAIVPI